MKRTEDAITGDIIAAFAKSPDIHATEIRIQAIGGHIILRGIVETLEEKDLAGRAAHSIEGVTSVENDLTISANRDVSDLNLQRKAQERLDTGNLSGIGVKTGAGNAILMGTAPNESVKEVAQRQVESVSGIRGVVDEVQVTAGTPVDDIKLINNVAQAISENPNIEGMDLDIQAKNGHITIYGDFPDENQVVLAATVAESVPGVKSVDNRTTVQGYIPRRVA